MEVCIRTNITCDRFFYRHLSLYHKRIIASHTGMYLYCVWKRGKKCRSVISVHSQAIHTSWHAKVGRERECAVVLRSIENQRAQWQALWAACSQMELENEAVMGKRVLEKTWMRKMEGIVPFLFFLHFLIFHLGHCFNLDSLLVAPNPTICLGKSINELEMTRKFFLVSTS